MNDALRILLMLHIVAAALTLAVCVVLWVGPWPVGGWLVENLVGAVIAWTARRWTRRGLRCLQ